MKLPLILALSATGLVVASPAAAQNVAPGGLYVGALAGYEGLDVDAQDGSASASADSAVYGVSAGYDLSLGGGFVGVEGEVSTSDGSTDCRADFPVLRKCSSILFVASSFVRWPSADCRANCQMRPTWSA